MEIKLLAALAGVLLFVGTLGGVGWWGYHYKSLYEASQAVNLAQQLADQKAATTVLAKQLTDAQTVADHNAQVMDDYHKQSDADKAAANDSADLIDRLLNDAARSGSCSRVVSTPQSRQTPTAARPPPSDGRLRQLLEGVGAECRANAQQLDALSSEVIPQLRQP